MILVVGATGQVGGRVVRQLAAGDMPVRAMVRPGADAAKVKPLTDAGATVFEGDLKDATSLRKACEGVATVVSTASATISRGAGDSIDTVDRDGQLRLVDAAREGGVRHFIYLSFSGNVQGGFPLHEAKRGVEARLKDSGLPYTILRPSFFMEVWLSPHAGFDPAGGTVRVYGSGDSPVSLISLADVAAYLTGCVGNPAVLNETIELGGPEAVTWNRVIELFERALGREIARQHVPAAALEQQMAGAPEALQRTLAGLALSVARGDAVDVGPALAKVNIRLTPVEEFVARAAGAR